MNLFDCLEVPRAFEKVATVICIRAEARLQWAEEDVRSGEMDTVIQASVLRRERKSWDSNWKEKSVWGVVCVILERRVSPQEIRQI